MVAATFAYLISVMQRTSLGVSGLQASERFHTNATELSSLAVLQIAIYAVMQIPVGVLLDRYGARALLLSGAVVMAIGQFIVAQATQLPAAVFGRAFVGLGDAFTFISMIRLINGWYEGHKAARLQQLMPSSGQAGQLLSALPFAFLLANFGWTFSFEIVSGASVIAALVVLLAVRNEPLRATEAKRSITMKTAIAQLKTNFQFPGTRMALWTHFTLQSSGSVFIFLWGVPYLVGAQGLTHTVASAMLGIFVVIGFLIGPILSWVASNRPAWRVKIVVTISSSIILVWIILSALPGRAPFWLLLIAVFFISLGGPASMLSFDFSRKLIPKERLGSANGIINMGGFGAAFLMLGIAGLILDFVQIQSGSPASALFSLDGFRPAMASQVFVLGAGLTMFLIELKKTRRLIEI